MYSTARQNIKTQLVLFKTLAANPKFWLIVSTDILLLIVAHYLANVIRFADNLAALDFFSFSFSTILLITIKIAVFYALGLYRGMWRYTSYNDILNIVKGTVCAAGIVIIILLFTNRFQGYSRSVFILDTLLTFLLISGHRVAIRHFYQNMQGPRKLFSKNRVSRKKRLLLVGAGAYAEKVMREIGDNTDLPYVVVGLVDDDPQKTGMKIHGIAVVGLIQDLEEHVRRVKAEEALIAISSISGSAMQRVVECCQGAEIPFKVLPGIGEIIDGKVSVQAMRDISYADLLGREEVRLDQKEIGSYLCDQVILVTGAGGSIGSELCRQVLRFAPKQIILFDASEENLYSIQMELQHEHQYYAIRTILGKVQDQGLLELVFQQYQPAVVFHAAAYKHVPLVENNPWQAIYNNVFAAQLLIEASIVHGVDRFVLVSTDKAVRPTNVMGASKRLTELLMMAYSMEKWDGSFCPARRRFENNNSDIFSSGMKASCHNTIFMAVRFGNVLGSSGSVIPLFKRQIEMGGPVTVTHQDITRYFMSIEEAAQLILQAGAMGQGREIFILKMGEPIKIAEMARDLIKLSGRQPDTEIEIKFTGLREGEKLYEELITEGEGIIETKHEKIMVLQGNSLTCSDLYIGLEELKQKAIAHDCHGIKDVLQQLIPEYTPDYKAESIKTEKKANHYV
ncbi:nucleoside-diphosphate sugar epimerase/dehydratase [Desulfogranum marinum]|uniref:polysaccharide biosynthesis protein n=1 Tax=Desulfogranum marinum TaxID=453220 RepID=UPI0029C7F518|nr:nucleoside-diphosphate sugar epimerase/dehydratase [Desulfogranum marinum]